MKERDLKELEKSLQVKFHDQGLFKQSLVHRSYLNEHPGVFVAHNERLEFLGDAVLELVVTEYIYEHYPEAPEGEMTNWRAALVNADTLANIAKELGIEDHLYLSKGESQDINSKARHYILANAMESVIGALYLDQGMDPCRKFVGRILLAKLPYILENKLYIDPKSRFQELAQEKKGITPMYKVLSDEGPDHAKRFVVGVYLGDKLIAEGTGTSKQEGQMAAAAAALDTVEWK
ncbi:MAG: ribonuclease III [bacterium]